MQFDNNYMEELFNNKENEKINDNVFNINPKIKYPKILKEDLSNNNEKTNFHNNNENQGRKLRKESFLNLKIPQEEYENIQFRERRTRSISFSDMSQLSNSNNYYERNAYNNVYQNTNNRNYQMANPNYKMSSGNIQRHRSYSNLNGTTTLAKKRSFRKPKVLLSSKEHIRRLKKMKSSSAISFKQSIEENKPLKRRYSIHSPVTPKLYSFDDVFYGDRFEDSFSDLPPNTLYHELKQAREKELQEMKLEHQKQDLEILDEETMYYDSDSTLRSVKTKSINDENENDESNNSLMKLLLKYLENSINKESFDSMNGTMERGIPNNVLEKDIPEDIIQNSYIFENSQYSDEESEIHKQEELLESLFNDVIKNFYGYQSKFFTTILKLISFLFYNGGKMELGKQLVKYVLKDKMGINISSSDDISSLSHDINHIGNEDIEFFTLNEIKEAKRHERRRRNGYKSINRIWMIIHNIAIIFFAYIFLINKQPIDSINTTSFVSNKNLVSNTNEINLKHEKNILYENSIFVEITPVTWFTSDNDYQISRKQQCYYNNYTGNKINNKCNQKQLIRSKKSNKFNNWMKEISPWTCLAILECILITAQLGFQYVNILYM
ncbi:hypothetical protein PIROE2DRAFT_19818 [Piromyces sp. E2]|nr:hypothetical protein PIROE2DRAFT_19818 [Piromyces sp. E2]|eukprot:OUM68602.1 hypothetical protein PIROE2DRAFT_19818 [Piromyces sp. E2]